MNTIIQNTISQYFVKFIENVSNQFTIPIEQLENIWKDVQKEKLVVKKRVNVNRKPSAYINFCNHHRKIIKSDNPELTFGEVAKKLGNLWKELDVDEKKKYSDPTYVSINPKPEEEKKKRGRKGGKE